MKKNGIVCCSTTLRQYVLVTFLFLKRERTVQEEAADIFRTLTEKLFSEFQIKRLIISRQKNETGSRKLFAGICCENASKHTYVKKVEQAFSESTAFQIYKVESKKSLGSWAFSVLGEEKELLMSYGGPLFQIEGLATAFKQHREIPHKLVENSPAVDKANLVPIKGKKVKKKAPKKSTPYLNAEGPVKRLVSFLFLFAPRLFYRRTVNRVAYIWIALIITLCLSIVVCFIAFFFDLLNISINYGTAEKFNKLMESLSISLIRIPIPSPPPLPWYHYKSVGGFFFKIMEKSFVSFCSEKCKEFFRAIWDHIFPK